MAHSIRAGAVLEGREGQHPIHKKKEIFWNYYFKKPENDKFYVKGSFFFESSEG